MGNTAEVAGFTPTGLFFKSTELPDPTSKTHTDLGLSGDDLLAVLRSMQRQRRFEERCAQSYQKGKFGGFLHLYIGQEALSSGVTHVLNNDDDIITAYRDHGWGLARGISARAGMAEMFGKGAGCSRGKGGSMHFFDVKNHFWGGHAIVGAHIPLAAGIAMANKYKENGRVCVCFFGDGAVDQGALHETFNMAQLWKLPVIFVVENNGYSMGTAVMRHSATEIHKRARAYDMKNDIVNGMDPFSVIEAFDKVVKDVRETSEPWFLEVRTYRYRGHSMSDPQYYRSKEEVEEFRSIDAIEKLKGYILDNKLAKQADLDAMWKEIEDEMLDAVNFADETPFPEAEELYQDTYIDDDLAKLTW